jgi:FtsZ-binding cell division protein ZapB
LAEAKNDTVCPQQLLNLEIEEHKTKKAKVGIEASKVPYYI